MASATKKKGKEKKKFDRKSFKRKEVPEGMGEFRLRKGFGKHILSENNKDMTIKGKRLKRIVEPGDILVCPPSKVGAFMDKFMRIDVLPKKEKVEQKRLKREHHGGGRYNVINIVSGVKLNDGFLTKDEANEMIVSEGVKPTPDEPDEEEEFDEYEEEENDDETIDVGEDEDEDDEQ